MVGIIHKQAQGTQWHLDRHDHIEVETYTKKQNKHSRFTSYILNILYNANTSFWAIVGIQSLCESFGYNILMWPFYLTGLLFSAGNAVYDIISTAEIDKEHQQKKDALSTLLSDEKLSSLQSKLVACGADFDLVNYAKQNTCNTILNDLISDYLDTLESISCRLAMPNTTPRQKQQLILARTKLMLTMRELQEKISDKELAYRLNVCLKDNLNTPPEKYKIPLIAKGYFWISRNFYTFTTGAITITGLATFFYSLLGLSGISMLKLFPWSVLSIILLAAAGATINFVLNKYFFDTHLSQHAERKDLKNQLKNKEALIKEKVKIQQILYQADAITPENYIAKTNIIDVERQFYETTKLHKPSSFRRNVVPFLVAAFSLYSGYGIAYSLTAPFYFIGLPFASWVIPLIGIPLAILFATKKGLEYKDSLNEANHKFNTLKNVVPREQIHLYQHKLNLAGVNENVADIIYDLSRKQILNKAKNEHQALIELISHFETNVPTNLALLSQHKKTVKQLHQLLRNVDLKIDKHTQNIRNTKHKNRVTSYFNQDLQNPENTNTFKYKFKSGLRKIIDVFEDHYSDFFDGGSTIAGIAAATLFLIVSTPGLSIIIPVLIGSFILGGVGATLFKLLFEDSSQYTLTNVKNTKQKLLDKASTYKLLQPSLIAQKQAQEIINEWDHKIDAYRALIPNTTTKAEIKSQSFQNNKVQSNKLMKVQSFGQQQSMAKKIVESITKDVLTSPVAVDHYHGAATESIVDIPVVA